MESTVSLQLRGVGAQDLDRASSSMPTARFAKSTRSIGFPSCGLGEAFRRTTGPFRRAATCPARQSSPPPAIRPATTDAERRGQAKCLGC
jgi:hypothetical protein